MWFLYIILLAVILAAIGYTQFSYLRLKAMLTKLPIQNIDFKASSDISVSGLYKGKSVNIRMSRLGRCSLPYVSFEILINLPFEMHIFRGMKPSWLGFGYERIETGNEEIDSKYFIEVKGGNVLLIKRYFDLQKQYVVDAIFQNYQPGITRPWVNMILFNQSAVEIKIQNFSYKTLISEEIIKNLDLMVKLAA